MAPYLLAAATSYETPAVKALVHKLKFRSIRKAAEPLGDLVIRYLEKIDLDLEKFTLIPLPLSRRRFYERGFNQAEAIARRIISAYGGRLMMRGDVLMRSKNTKPQTETTTRKERITNIHGCFTVREAAAVAGKNVLLFDDVTTSGATLLEAARTLKTAGARTIVALVVAKA